MSSKKSLSFAASIGKPTFDWRAFLSRTNQADAEWDTAIALAGRWTTCSCGNLCAVLPRVLDDPESGYYGAPVDKILQRLGGEDDNGFFRLIKAKDAREALNILDLIELRVGYLLNKMRQDAQDELKAAKVKVAQLEAALS